MNSFSYFSQVVLRRVIMTVLIYYLWTREHSFLSNLQMIQCNYEARSGEWNRRIKPENNFFELSRGL